MACRRAPAAAKFFASSTLFSNYLEVALEFACNDFARVAGGMPIEAQVYEAWVNAVTFKDFSDVPAHNQHLILRAIGLGLFPRVREVSTRPEQKAIGLQVMKRALCDPSLEMKINRVVPPKSPDGMNTRP